MSEPVYEDRAQHVVLDRAQAFRGHLAVRIEDRLELLVEVLDRPIAGLPYPKGCPSARPSGVTSGH
jgi:hypothetical protein